MGPAKLAARHCMLQAPSERSVDWAVLAERCGLWTFLAKWEALLIDDWQVRTLLTGSRRDSDSSG